jgi:colicin import membrane protein
LYNDDPKAPLTRKENYRVTLLLAALLHILLFSVLFLTFHHSPKRFLNAATPPIIYATAVAVENHPLSVPDVSEKEKIKLPPKTEKTLIKPVLIEKSPNTLMIKEKKVANTAVNASSVPTKTYLQDRMASKKILPKQPASAKSLTKEKNTHHALSTQSLQLAQKNVQQLLQQEVNTLVQRHQVAVRNTATTEKYRHLILQSIAQHWIVPPELDKHLETKLAVHLAPGGMVVEVVIVKSSGNSVLDRSAQSAVYKASPLPVPKNGLFNTFRQINLTVRPEGVLTQ